ncbi:MAG: hypothetical protein RBU35_22295, partial [Anaerolineae bacterium]|nr:hypothetical protein [Anaerolineae bacterium]
MRKLIFAALCLALAGPAWAAKQSSYDTKATPASADKVLITDSEASNAPKQVTLGAIAALSPSMTYPGTGVPNSTGSAWGASYTVGTAANNLVQLNASAQLPAVSGALLTNIPTPTWMPSSAPAADNMIIQATGGCSDLQYTDQATCEANSGTWTPPVGAWTSIIDGLINDAGTGTDDLLSASEIDTRISSAGAFYQLADGDLDAAAGASAAGNSKLFGTNASGVVGWYDIPVDTDTDDQVASEVGFTPNGSIAATTVQAAVQEVRDDAEPALGNPAANGYVLSSTTTGTRSWIAQSSGGSVDLTAPGPIGSVTPNTGAFTTLVADSFDFTAPVSGTTGEIGLQEDPDNGSSLVTLK